MEFDKLGAVFSTALSLRKAARGKRFGRETPSLLCLLKKFLKKLQKGLAI